MITLIKCYTRSGAVIRITPDKIISKCAGVIGKHNELLCKMHQLINGQNKTPEDDHSSGE